MPCDPRSILWVSLIQQYVPNLLKSMSGRLLDWQKRAERENLESRISNQWHSENWGEIGRRYKALYSAISKNCRLVAFVRSGNIAVTVKKIKYFEQQKDIVNKSVILMSNLGFDLVCFQTTGGNGRLELEPLQTLMIKFRRFSLTFPSDVLWSIIFTCRGWEIRFLASQYYLCKIF